MTPRRLRSPTGRPSGSAPRGRPGSARCPDAGWPATGRRQSRPTARARSRPRTTREAPLPWRWPTSGRRSCRPRDPPRLRRRSRRAARPGSRWRRRGAIARPRACRPGELRGDRGTVRPHRRRRRASDEDCPGWWGDPWPGIDPIRRHKPLGSWDGGPRWCGSCPLAHLVGVVAGHRPDVTNTPGANDLQVGAVTDRGKRRIVWFGESPTYRSALHPAPNAVG